MTDVHSPSAHYDRVTRAWRLLLGDELHYGVFAHPGMPLGEATSELTRLVLEAGHLKPGTRALDIGCGTGAPACSLAQAHDVQILGISTSEFGIAAAQRRADDLGLSHRVEFELRDGMATGLPDSSFDFVYVLEASHLMPDRAALVAEVSRVLRPGGRFSMCDIVRKREIPFAELRARSADFATLREAFGHARMDPIAAYTDLLAAADITVDVVDDLTEATLPTFEAWRTNAAVHADDVRDALGDSGLEAFVRSTDILESFWKDGTLGYGLIAGTRSPLT